jgi:hypothetical protein
MSTKPSFVLVIPAKAGISSRLAVTFRPETPAFAGVTVRS